MQQEDLPMERNPTYQEPQKSLSSCEQKTAEYKNALKRLEMEKQQLQEALNRNRRIMATAAETNAFQKEFT